MRGENSADIPFQPLLTENLIVNQEGGTRGAHHYSSVGAAAREQVVDEALREPARWRRLSCGRP